jgi:hypothetical protein
MEKLLSRVKSLYERYGLHIDSITIDEGKEMIGPAFATLTGIPNDDTTSPESARPRPAHLKPGTSKK